MNLSASHPSPARRRRRGFTLIELLVVMSIMGILVGMVASTTNSARQSAYRSQANAEVREIGKALRGYWLCYQTWKYTPAVGQWLDADVSNLEFLRGQKSKVNPGGIVFLDLSNKKFEASNDGKDAFVDPWGTPYQFYMEQKSQSTTLAFSCVVSFPMRNRR